MQAWSTKGRNNLSAAPASSPGNASGPHVPPTRIEYELLNYVWQIMGTLNGANVLATFNITRRAKVTYSYVRTTNPGSIAQERLPRVTLFANVFYYTEGSYSNPTLGSEVIARDDTLERWMGNIWVKTHTTIVI
jgi:hypothetical protein